MPALVKVGVNRPDRTDRIVRAGVPGYPRRRRARMCAYNAEGQAAAEDIDAPGSDVNAGRFLQADLEGLSIITSVPGHTLMLASSQGDSSFHFYGIQSNKARHLGSFPVDGVGGTDGVHYTPVPLSRRYPSAFSSYRTETPGTFRPPATSTAMRSTVRPSSSS